MICGILWSWLKHPQEQGVFIYKRNKGKVIFRRDNLVCGNETITVYLLRITEIRLTLHNFAMLWFTQIQTVGKLISVCIIQNIWQNNSNPTVRELWSQACKQSWSPKPFWNFRNIFNHLIYGVMYILKISDRIHYCLMGTMHWPTLCL